MHRRRFSLIALLSVVFLVGGLGWTIYVPIRQERLNRTLITAIKNNDTKTTLALLDQGADPNARDTPPMAFSMRRMLWQMLHKPATARNSPTALTLAMGVKIQADVYGSGLFCCADDYAEKAGVQIVKALCEHGANVNSRGPGGYTPLMAAAFTPASSVITKMLLNRGAQVNARSNEGETALILAAAHSHSQTIPLLVDRGADVNAEDDNGETPLLMAVMEGHKDIVHYLLEKGANVNLKNRVGKTALIEAIQVREDVALVKLLLDNGADVTIKDMDGFTALRWAANTYKTDIVNVLQQAGAKE